MRQADRYLFGSSRDEQILACAMKLHGTGPKVYSSMFKVGNMAIQPHDYR
ncbi:MAG: hypothetical protein JWM47_4582 [Acidimicrobiales bacterium]|nr:hypothetical protein [Acidimicrobiales bacterium]